jgi:transposase
VVQERLRLDPFSCAAFVFRSKRADRMKLLVWNGSGLILIYKRLDEARFVWPRIEDGVMRLSPDSWARCSKGSTGSGCTAVE